MVQFRVKELRLPLVEHPASAHAMYLHQAAVWDGWSDNATILLAAKTGSGKTRAAMLPILKGGECAVAVYPTNELVRDQVKSVEKLSRAEGINSLVWTPQVRAEEDWLEQRTQADRLLIPLDGPLLDKWQQVERSKNRCAALRRLLEPDKPKVVFTNPDILFLILGLKYHAEAFEALIRYRTLIIDEFHLYQGVELAHALAMVSLARGFGIFQRLVLLSATPDRDVQRLLVRAVDPTIIGFEVAGDDYHGEQRVAVHPVVVTAIQTPAGDVVELLRDQLVQMKPDLERLRQNQPDGEYLPAVVIVSSVAGAIRLEDRLAEAGFARESLAIIRGLSHRAVRGTQGKLLALGTSAIEVGVDFHCDHLLFEASDAGSFLQRFGRAGRHSPGNVTVLVPPNVLEGMRQLPADVSRADFEERIHAWYPSASAYPWFVTTEYGMVTARALCESLISAVQRDGNAKPETLAELRERVETILSDHASRLECPAMNNKARLAFSRATAGKSSWRWLKAYCKLNRFRTSLPTIRVHDFTEQNRRKEWSLGEYEVDLKTLLSRGVGIAWNEHLNLLTIRGIGKYQRVHASELFGPNDCGAILETQGYPLLRLYQEGESCPVSDLMGRENHAFAVVSKDAVMREVDWRLPVFEAGEYMIAFDGAALLLVELYRRTRR